MELLPLMGPNLDKSDLIRFESVIKESLSSLFSFKSYSLYFPQEIPESMLKGHEHVPIVEKDRALLPLVINGRFLGIFLARGINQRQVNSLKKHCSLFISLCLEKLILFKKCMLDQLTGLYNEEHFFTLVRKEVEAVLSSITPGPEATMDNGQSRHKASFCIILLNLDRFRSVNDTYGFSFGDRILADLASHLKKMIPEQATPARLHQDNFALLWPQTSQKKSLKLAQNIIKSISDIIFEFDVSGEKLAMTVSAGISLFPQDIKGPQFRKSSYELSKIIVEKAKQSMEMARENGGNRVYSFGSLLSQGGVVLETLPLDRLVVNLGKNVDTYEGHKFMVWSGKFNGQSEIIKESDKTAMGHYPPIHKGEIIIQETQDRISIAEVLYLNDPSWQIESGDKLTLLSDKDSLLEKEGLSGQGTPQKDIMTGLYSYRDFLSLWNSKRSAAKEFCMAMIKVQDFPRERNNQGIQSENLILKIVKRFQNKMLKDFLGGRYSSKCLIFYLPEHKPEDLKPLFAELSSEIREDHEAFLYTGISAFPCLNFSSIDTLENCRKALEHAALEDFPYVAVFDSLTLTISADRLFTKGDNFAAMEEYKTALAVQESNILARNSLAVCYARLGRLELARKYFQEITEMDNENLMAWYNLACVCLKQDDISDAEKNFTKCLEIDPNHAFSLFRMGQLAEKGELMDKAEKFYVQAGQTSDGIKLASRHLARLAWKRGLKEEAREHLHQALIHNPRDAFSLNLMARIYIESGEDPQIAESLARQSVALRPDVDSFWLDLAETLKVQGLDEQAAQARARAHG